MEEERKKLEKIYQELNEEDTDIKKWNQALIPKTILLFPPIAFALTFLKINTDKSLIDLLGFLILFLLIFLFNRSKQRLSKKPVNDIRLQRFISSKKIVSVTLFGVLGLMLLSSLGNWIINFINEKSVLNIDSLFFNQFFTLLILADVVILLISFRYTEEYSKLIRNTGFIIATILIRLSFSAEGYLTMVLILTGVIFAYLILQIFNAIENPKVTSTA